MKKNKTRRVAAEFDIPEEVELIEEAARIWTGTNKNKTPNRRGFVRAAALAMAKRTIEKGEYNENV